MRIQRNGSAPVLCPRAQRTSATAQGKGGYVQNIFLWTVLGVALLLLGGCGGPPEGLTGEYTDQTPTALGATLHLRPDGGGDVTVAGTEAPFHWEVPDNDQVLLHMLHGGNVVLRRAPEGAVPVLEGDLPEVGRVVLRKTVRTAP